MAKKKTEDTKENYLILPLFAIENYALTPMIPQPLKIDNEEQKRFLESCNDGRSEIFVVSAYKDSKENSEKDIKSHGIICIVDRILQMPGAPSLAFLRPLCRGLFQGIVYSPSCQMAKVLPLKDITPPKRKSKSMDMMKEHVEDLFHSVMRFIGEPEKSTTEKLIAENSSSPVQHLYAMSHVAPFTWEEKVRIIEADSFKELLVCMASLLDEAEQKVNLQAQIHEKTHHELSRQQKEAFLRMHLKQIQEELGEGEDYDDISDLITKSSKMKWPTEAKDHFSKELKKLKRLNINNPEYSVQYSYLESLLELPWNNYHNKQISLDKVEEVLNRDHFGLEKVKERILEYMAVLKLRNDLKAPILCLYGPPGVGKTSIGKSIAEAVGREYSRISLGGMHDEAEIRGHRRTYIGAMPGRFLHALSKCKFGNPLMLLDEIDKVGKDYKGDPSSALLEALDPEQNNTFHDNFIDVPYDLSRVLFIATANDLSSIPPPLRDRMEIIEMEGYSNLEKREIAVRHLVKKALNENGMKESDIRFSTEAIDTIIKNFTHEKGVRQLNKAINRVIRKLALQKVKGVKLPDEVSPDMVKTLLDKRDFQSVRIGFNL